MSGLRVAADEVLIATSSVVQVAAADLADVVRAGIHAHRVSGRGSAHTPMRPIRCTRCCSAWLTAERISARTAIAGNRNRSTSSRANSTWCCSTTMARSAMTIHAWGRTTPEQDVPLPAHGAALPHRAGEYAACDLPRNDEWPVQLRRHGFRQIVVGTTAENAPAVSRIISTTSEAGSPHEALHHHWWHQGSRPRTRRALRRMAGPVCHCRGPQPRLSFPMSPGGARLRASSGTMRRSDDSPCSPPCRRQIEKRGKGLEPRVPAASYRGNGDSWAGELAVSLTATKILLEGLAPHFDRPSGDRSASASLRPMPRHSSAGIRLSHTILRRQR